MSLIRKPSEIQEKKNLVMMVYGSPGDGKTTLALSAPKPILLDTDGGVGRTLASHRCDTVQPEKWEDVNSALDEITALDYKTIVVDTVGKLLDMMSDFIIKDNPKMRKFDGTLSLQGYGVRKRMFKEFINRCLRMGRNVVFVAHAEESKVGDDIKVEPIIGGSSANDLMTEIDLVGYLTNIGGKRMIFWGNDGTAMAKQFVSKNTCFLPNAMEIPVVADASGNALGKNDYLSKVFEQYAESQKKKEKLNAEYAELVSGFADRIAACESIDDVNVVFKAVMEAEHIYDSKLVIWGKLTAKASSLKCKYSKVELKFIPDATEVQV